MNKPREIKFRAWNGKNKEFVYEVLCCGEDINSVLNSKTSGLIFQQFTGLHDKNGKEIYEGDILKDPAHYPNGYQHSLNNQTGVAYYDTELGGWYITNNLTDGKHETPNTQTLQLATAKNYKVIGNIYENKDLLN